MNLMLQTVDMSPFEPIKSKFTKDLAKAYKRLTPTSSPHVKSPGRKRKSSVTSVEAVSTIEVVKPKIAKTK